MPGSPNNQKEFNPIKFKMQFRAGLTILAFISAMGILLLAMVNPTAASSKYTGNIIGFVTGSLITLILSFYFGSSEGIDASPGEIPPTLPKPEDTAKLTAKIPPFIKDTPEPVIPTSPESES